MKKSAFLFVCFLASTYTGNCQFFIGGNVSFNGHGGKSENGTDNSIKSPGAFSFNLSPQLGFQISDKLDLGSYLNFDVNHTDNNLDPAFINNTTTIGIEPFVRYYAFIKNKFSIYGEFRTNFDYSLAKSKNGDVNIDDTKDINLGFSAYPGMSYKISEKLELMALLNFFGLGLTHDISKTGDSKESSTYFHFFTHMDYLVTTGSISIGAIYRFK